MKKLLLLTLLAAAACSSNKNKEASAPYNAFTLIFRSTGNIPLMAFPHLTPSEEENLTSHYVANPGDTLLIPLQAHQQLIDLFHQVNWDNAYIIAAGDTILADLGTTEKAVYRLARGKKERLITAEEEAFGESTLRKEPDEQLQKMIEAGKSNQAGGIAAYIKRHQDFYEQHRDSLLKTKDLKAHILADVILLEQYNQLSDLNAALKDKELTALLKSDKYLSLENYNNRNLGGLFNTYSQHNIVIKSRSKPLVDIYKTEFEGFPEEIKANFKLTAITQMIVQKYDRKTTIRYIDDYIANYGLNTVLKDWMKQIQYGIAESDDLNLTDAGNGKETLSNLIKPWKGKVIYLDFWASWCGPCLAEFPYSKKLRTELKDVVFVYLALEDEDPAWRKAIETYDLKENSFLITNSETSGFVSRYKINTLPRYMIINTKGEIINSDAPRPSSKEIGYLLKKAMK